MLSLRVNLTLAFSAALLVSPAFASHVRRSPTAGSAHHSHRLSTHHRHHYYHRIRGQQAIAPERVTQIQQALIRVHYLDGEANGKWDSSTIAAMQKYQADHGWQTKLMPDSRALEKLGLGPDYSNAINAKNSTFASPAAPPSASTAPTDTISSAQAAGFAAAAGVDQ